MAKKKENSLVNLLEGFKTSDMSAEEFAQIIFGLSKLQPDFFGSQVSPAKPRRSPSRQPAETS